MEASVRRALYVWWREARSLGFVVLVGCSRRRMFRRERFVGMGALLGLRVLGLEGSQGRWDGAALLLLFELRDCEEILGTFLRVGLVDCYHELLK